jgi:hypothetical protein
MRYYSREDVGHTYYRRYDEMTYSERRLGLAQQKLASLLLASVKESTDQLDSDVQDLRDATATSAGVLEYLTRVLIAVTLVIVLQPLIVQLFGVWILPIVAIAFILITAFLTSIFRKMRDLGSARHYFGKKNIQT